MGVRMEKEINKGFDAGRLTIEEVVFFSFFIILSVTKGLGFYEWQKMFILLIIPAFFFGLLKILISRYTKRQRVIVIVLLILTTIVCYESEEVGILFVMFTILGMKNISVDKVLRLGLWVWTICGVVLCIVQFFRIEHTVYRVSDKLGLGYIMRWSLGFTHPNILHITYLALCAFILYELEQRYRFKHFILLMLGNVLVFFYSVSYTGFGIVTVLLIGELYVNFRPKFCLLEKIAVNLVLPFAVVVSFVLPILLNVPQTREAVDKLNWLVNTRIYVASHYLVPECMSLFGVRMSYLAQIQSYLSIDNSYVWAFIHYGAIPFVLFILAYFVLIADYCKRQKTRELVFIVCFLTAGLTEPLLFNTSFKNVTLLFMGELLFRQKEGEEEYDFLPVLRKKTEGLVDLFLAKVKVLDRLRLLAELPSRAVRIWRAYRKRVLSGIAAGVVLGAVLCAVCYSIPKGYIVPRRSTDWREKTSVYLESSEDPSYEGYRIMNYRDAETPMQIVEGKAVMLETARYYLGSMLIGGLAAYLVGTGMLILLDKGKIENITDR